MQRYFDLRLTPSRSLGQRHARWLVAGVAGVFLLGGLRLLAIGAWPVIPFMAVDVALLAWALRASDRLGRACEILWLDDAALTVRKVGHDGVERRFTLEPAWTRVQLERLSGDENRLWLATRNTRLSIGSALSPAERVEVHAVIADGLQRCHGR